LWAASNVRFFAVSSISNAEPLEDEAESGAKAPVRRGRLRFGRESTAPVMIATAGGTTIAPRLFDDAGDALARLEAHNAHLEKQIAELLNQPPDLSNLSDADLAVLASDAAASILRLARKESEAVALAAKEQSELAKQESADRLERAKHEADEVLQTAVERAKSLLESAEAEDMNVRQAADVFATETRQKAREESEAMVALSRSAAEAIMTKVNLEAEQFVESATSRRDAIFADLEVQRRLMQTTLEDSAAVQTAFTESYGHLRKSLDEALAHLIAPVQRARRQVANLDRELLNQKRDEDLVDFGPARRYGLARNDPQSDPRSRKHRPRG
jgi:hypothetical protein